MKLESCSKRSCCASSQVLKALISILHGISRKTACWSTQRAAMWMPGAISADYWRAFGSAQRTGTKPWEESPYGPCKAVPWRSGVDSSLRLGFVVLCLSTSLVLSGVYCLLGAPSPNIRAETMCSSPPCPDCSPEMSRCNFQPGPGTIPKITHHIFKESLEIYILQKNK